MTSKAKFDLKGQNCFFEKVAHLTKKSHRKNLVLIFKIACKLWDFEIFNLASEVIFDLGGQSLFFVKVVHLTKEHVCKIW